MADQDKDGKSTAVKDKTDDKKKSGSKDEADEILKQMQDKEDSGDCAFC